MLDKNSNVVMMSSVLFMTFERGHTGFLIAFIVVGALLGSSLAVLLAKAFPSLSFIKENITAPLGFNLDVLAVNIKVNLGTLVGIIAGVIFFWKA